MSRLKCLCGCMALCSERKNDFMGKQIKKKHTQSDSA